MRIELDFAAVLSQWPLLVSGVLWTLGLTVISAVLGVLLGVLFAWARLSGPLWFKWVAGIYVEFIRNTPFIVQLFFIFFGLPMLGVKLSPEASSVIAMVVNLGAYATEIIRAGIRATPRGQIEAAASLAMNRFQIFIYGDATFQQPGQEKVSPLAQEWRSFLNRDDQFAADLIRGDGIDILIGLIGHIVAERMTLPASACSSRGSIVTALISPGRASYSRVK